MKDFRNAIFYFSLGGILFGSLALVGISFLAEYISVVIGVAITLLIIIGLFGLAAAFYKDRVCQAVFQTSRSRFSDILEPVSAAIKEASEGNYKSATANTQDAVRILAAAYTWMSLRGWILTTAISVLLAFASVVGASLVFRQVKLLDAQNLLLERQNHLLQVQNEQLVKQTLSTTKQTEVSEYQYKLAKSVAAPAFSVISDSDRNITVYALGGVARDLEYDVRSWIVSTSNTGKRYGINIEGLYFETPRETPKDNISRREAVILQLYSEAQTHKAIMLQTEAVRNRTKCEQLQWISILVLRYKDLIEESHVVYYDVTSPNPKLLRTVPPFIVRKHTGTSVNLSELRNDLLDPADQLAAMIQKSKTLLCTSKIPKPPYVELIGD